MAIALGDGNQFAFIEDRFDHPDIGKMGASGIGVVDGNDIPGVEFIFKVFQDGFGREMEGPHMNGNVV
jgi:hypothetical protein